MASERTVHVAAMHGPLHARSCCRLPSVPAFQRTQSCAATAPRTSSGVSNSTMPQPLERPVSSLTTLAYTTTPTSLNWSLRSCTTRGACADQAHACFVLTRCAPAHAAFVHAAATFTGQINSPTCHDVRHARFPAGMEGRSAQRTTPTHQHVDRGLDRIVQVFTSVHSYDHAQPNILVRRPQGC